MGIQVKKMKAGDPGIGFKIAITSDGVDIDKDLSITATIIEPALAAHGDHDAIPSKTHTFNMTVSKPLTTNEDLVFVLSYCSKYYNEETKVDVDITVQQDGAQLFTSGDDYHQIDANKDQHFDFDLVANTPTYPT